MCIRIEEGKDVGGGFESVTEFKIDCIFLFALICLYGNIWHMDNGRGMDLVYSTSCQTLIDD
jgi:hypothetical protein